MNRNINIEIRPFSKEYLDGLYEIECACFPHPWSKESLLSLADEEKSVCLMAICDGHAVGYVGMYLAGGDGMITNIAVLEAYRNIGIATLLLHSLIDKAKSSGLTLLNLEVRASNEKAIDLYKKFGFYKVGVRKKYYFYPIEDAILMDLKL